MAKPKLNSVVHIPFIKFDEYVKSKVKIPKNTLIKNSGNRDVNYYYQVIVDSHMFRGNDSSKNFFNQFMEETIDPKFQKIFSFLDPKILDIVFTERSPKKMNELIVQIPEKTWLAAYVQIITNAQAVLDALGKEDEYYLGYMIAGVYESAVMSSYQIKDYHQSSMNKYFWHFSW